MSWHEAEELFRDENTGFQTWTPDQDKANRLWQRLDNNRLLLFYPTGKGKTKTSLGMMYAKGYRRVIVIAPPATHKAWELDARTLGMGIFVMSVEKFRRKETKLPRDTPIIVDEFHLMGGHGAAGFTKMDRIAAKIPAIILASATPNYNDAERVYCIAHVLDPLNHAGSFLAWLYRHCETTENPFARTPYVEGFLAHDSAADFLVAQGYTAYISDDASWKEEEYPLANSRRRDQLIDEITEYGLDRYRRKMVASDMERRHRLAYLYRANPATDKLWTEVAEQLSLTLSDTTWLVFCQHATVAEAVYNTLREDETRSVHLITGKTSNKEAIKWQFINDPNPAKVLIGTSTLATGMDGLNKVCEQLLIFDDIEGDDSKRRQLIGRVLPRGTQQRDTRVVFAR